MFNFDQLKLADWFRQDSIEKVDCVFVPKNMSKGIDVAVTFHESLFQYDSNAAEPLVPNDEKESFACGLG